MVCPAAYVAGRPVAVSVQEPQPGTVAATGWPQPVTVVDRVQVSRTAPRVLGIR